MKLPEFDSTKEFETFHNVEGIQIIKIDTDDSNKYIERMAQWYEELKPYTSPEGTHKVLHVYFKAPPLSAVLKFIEIPLPYVFVWSAVAIIEPPDTVVEKFNPIINWAARLNKNKERVTTRLYSHDYINKLDEVKKWLDDEIARGPGGNDHILKY